MSDLTKNEILKALKKVDDSNFNKDFLILNSIKKFELIDNKLSVYISITLPASADSKQLQVKFAEALKKEYTYLTKVDVTIDAKVTTHQDTSKNAILPGVKNTIAVASGKGGVGKSTVAVNLAVALSNDGANVGLIDADIYGPSIPLLLGIKDKPKIFQDQKTMKMIPLTNYGIKVISIGLLIDDNSPVIWRGPMASGAVKQFMTDVDWGELDYLIFDLPPGTGDIQLTLVQTIPLTGAVIVTTPQEVSLNDARKALKMFTRVNVPILGVIENMSYFIAPDTGKKYDIFGNGGGSKMAVELDATFLGGIPIDPQIRIGGDNGVPVLYDAPDSEFTAVFTQLSRNLAAQVHIRNLKSNSASKMEIILNDDE